jgi:hypothetical protein
LLFDFIGFKKKSLKKLVQKPDLSSRLVNWVVKLGEFDIEFHSRIAIKAQVLADVIVEFNNISEGEEIPKVIHG